MNNNYISIICKYCPYTEYGINPSEYISGNGTYTSCEGVNCKEAYENYIEKTEDDTKIEDLF